MTDADRLRRIEERIRREYDSVSEALARLEGIRDPRIARIRASYEFMRNTISTELFGVRREIACRYFEETERKERRHRRGDRYQMGSARRDA